MKRILSHATAAIIAAALFAACADEAENQHEGEGKVRLDVRFGAAPPTRADSPRDCTVRISDSGGSVIYEFSGTDGIPSEIVLLSGSYTLAAEAGTRQNQGFETPFAYFYEGAEQFTVKKGESVSVSLSCPVRNNIFTAEFDRALTDELTDYSFTLHVGPGCALGFDADNQGAEACVMLDDGQTAVDWTFEAKHHISGDVSKSGTLEGLTQGRRYDLTVSHTIHKGELGFSVRAEESQAGERTMTVFQAPVIAGEGFDLAQTQSPGRSYRIVAAASSEITDVVLSGSVFGAGYDLLDTANDPAAQYGVEVEKPLSGKTVFTFGPSLFAMMTGMTNTVSIEMTDANAKKACAVFTVTAADPGIENVRRADIWATRATVKGAVVETAENVGFAYRIAGHDDWKHVPAVMNEPYRYGATITGLDPGTDYEAVLFADEAMVGSPAGFTTEEAAQPPNAGFEDWSKPAKPWLLYTNAAEKFWDTDNEDATAITTAGNVTAPVDDKRTDSKGSQSAKMNSRYLGLSGMGKFIAGNIYSGDYAGSGKADLGRRFVSRPSAMSVWYKSTAGKVNYPGGELNNGDTDRYRIWVALTDWEDPHRIDKEDQGTFIDYDTDPGIIAFGEVVGSATVAEWKNVRIDLRYRSLERVPKYIVIAASASMYGDYSAGSTDSMLQIDDLELIYDDRILTWDLSNVQQLFKLLK